jgi:hypothetical protein
MTTITQQITFIEALRESHDNNQREAMQSVYPPSVVAELLRDIHENLLAVKLWQVKTDVPLCGDCNQPIEPNERVHFAADGGRVLVARGEIVCARCTELRKVNSVNHFNQL